MDPQVTQPPAPTIPAAPSAQGQRQSVTTPARSARAAGGRREEGQARFVRNSARPEVKPMPGKYPAVFSAIGPTKDQERYMSLDLIQFVVNIVNIMDVVYNKDEVLSSFHKLAYTQAERDVLLDQDRRRFLNTALVGLAIKLTACRLSVEETAGDASYLANIKLDLPTSVAQVIDQYGEFDSDHVGVRFRYYGKITDIMNRLANVILRVEAGDDLVDAAYNFYHPCSNTDRSLDTLLATCLSRLITDEPSLDDVYVTSQVQVRSVFSGNPLTTVMDSVFDALNANEQASVTLLTNPRPIAAIGVADFPAYSTALETLIGPFPAGFAAGGFQFQRGYRAIFNEVIATAASTKKAVSAALTMTSSSLFQGRTGAPSQLADIVFPDEGSSDRTSRVISPVPLPASSSSLAFIMPCTVLSAEMYRNAQGVTLLERSQGNFIGLTTMERDKVQNDWIESHFKTAG